MLRDAPGDLLDAGLSAEETPNLPQILRQMGDACRENQSELDGDRAARPGATANAARRQLPGREPVLQCSVAAAGRWACHVRALPFAAELCLRHAVVLRKQDVVQSAERSADAEEPLDAAVLLVWR